jgi:hypothetical protein
MTDLRHENQQNGLGFERQDVGSKPVIAFIVSVVVIGVLVYYVIWGIFHFLDAYERKNQKPMSPMMQVEQDTREPDQAKTHEKIQQEFPEPRLEDNERTELNDFRYSEEERLNSAGWVDQSAGVAHIPITRAMELIAQRGLPTVPQAGTAPPSTVNMAREAAAKSDTSEGQKTPADNKTKGKQQ